MTIARKELNAELNGIEIYFNVFPIYGTRETLKKNGFKWNHKKGCWYAKYTSERNTIADTCVDISIDEYRDIARECNEEVKEIHHRKAGDIMDNLTFTWTKGTANSRMIEVFKANNIKWSYGYYFELLADLNRTGKMIPVDRYHIDGDLFGIMEKPKRTTSFFNLTSEELYKKNADGWTKEECLLCDSCVDAHPFCDDYSQALAKAEYYKSLGCYDIEILERINNKYAVVCY